MAALHQSGMRENDMASATAASVAHGGNEEDCVEILARGTRHLAQLMLQRSRET